MAVFSSQPMDDIFNQLNKINQDLWRTSNPKALLKESLARPLRDNGYKVALARNVIVRTLVELTATGAPLEEPRA